jgi:signal transduction histidine kinase
MRIGAFGEPWFAAVGPASWWPRLSLVQRFGLVSSGVLVLGMLVIGLWVSRKIESGVLHVAGATTALYVDSFVAPLVQELAEHDEISQENLERLDTVLADPAFSHRVRSVKIWLHDGTVVYATNKAIVGTKFPPKRKLRSALTGQISSSFDQLGSMEDVWERSLGIPLLEVYAPVRLNGTGRVIAVAEFYAEVGALSSDLARARRDSWAVAGATTMLMNLLLFLIVSKGSDTIERQKHALEARAEQLADQLRQNEILRCRVEIASDCPHEDAERIMRRLGAEFHDGPAQLLSLALLRLDAIKPSGDGQDLAVVRAALQEALKDIRNICAGLILPEVRGMTLRAALVYAVEGHERRTRTAVARDIADLPAHVPTDVKLSLCRFVQECLSNAFKHAGGQSQRVVARTEGGNVVVEVVDGGPGISKAPVGSAPSSRLGLLGLRDRIERLGGRVEIDSRMGVGTRVRAELPMRDGESRK